VSGGGGVDVELQARRGGELHPLEVQVEPLHDMQARAQDGTDQMFGLPADSTAAAVKQGWGNGSADDPDNAVVNSTGSVTGDRYVVVLLTEGDGNVPECDSRGFHAGQAAIVTSMAEELLPSLIG
jgi:O-acetyl-ADP-ribose deacetylase (regulator of RNase III)